MQDLNGRLVRCSRQGTLAVEAARDPSGTDLSGPVRRMPWQFHPARTIHEKRPGAARHVGSLIEQRHRSLAGHLAWENPPHERFLD